MDLLPGHLHVCPALTEINSAALAPADRGLQFGPTKTDAERVEYLHHRSKAGDARLLSAAFESSKKPARRGRKVKVST